MATASSDEGKTRSLHGRCVYSGSKSPGIIKWLVAVVLAVHLGLLGWAASRHSPVWDEAGHLVAGISHWEHGRFDLYRVNPPLVRMVATVPVVLAHPRSCWRLYDDRPGVRSERSIRKDFYVANGDRAFWLHILARWGSLPFSLLGAMICWQWARKLYGEASGILALVLWCFSPNILAHGQLITPDVGAGRWESRLPMGSGDGCGGRTGLPP